MTRSYECSFFPKIIRDLSNSHFELVLASNGENILSFCYGNQNVTVERSTGPQIDCHFIEYEKSLMCVARVYREMDIRRFTEKWTSEGSRLKD